MNSIWKLRFRYLLTFRVLYSILIVESLISRTWWPLGVVSRCTSWPVFGYRSWHLIPVEIIALLWIVWRNGSLIGIGYLDWPISEGGEDLFAGMRTIALALEIWEWIAVANYHTVIILEDVSWSHWAAGGQHLVGALDRLGANTRGRWGLSSFVSAACWYSPDVSMAWLRVSTTSRCHRGVDMLLLRSWSRSLLLLWLSIDISWGRWLLLAPNLLLRHHLSGCSLIRWHNITWLTRPHLLCGTTNWSYICLILIVVIRSNMTMACGCGLLHWVRILAD